MWLILAESDILSDHADGLGSDVQERGDVLQGKMLNKAEPPCGEHTGSGTMCKLVTYS